MSTENNLETLPAEEVELVPVYDEETGEMVRVNAKKRQLANLLQSRLDMATIVTAVVIKRMQEEKLYLALGYSSFSEYCELRLPFSRQTAYKYISIGKKFEDFLPSSKSDLQLTPGDTAKQLSDLGVAKLHELTKVEGLDLSELDEGRVILPDGTEISLDEVREQTARDFSKRIDMWKELAKSQEADIERAERERDKALLEKERIEKAAQEGLSYQKRFDSTAKAHHVYRQKVDDVRDAVINLHKCLANLKDTPTVFEDLVKEVRYLNERIQDAEQRLRDQNMYCFADAMLSSYPDELSGKDLKRHEHWAEHGMSPETKNLIDGTIDE